MGGGSKYSGTELVRLARSDGGGFGIQDWLTAGLGLVCNGVDARWMEVGEKWLMVVV